MTYFRSYERKLQLGMSCWAYRVGRSGVYYLCSIILHIYMCGPSHSDSEWSCLSFGMTKEEWTDSAMQIGHIPRGSKSGKCLFLFQSITYHLFQCCDPTCCIAIQSPLIGIKLCLYNEPMHVMNSIRKVVVFPLSFLGPINSFAHVTKRCSPSFDCSIAVLAVEPNWVAKNFVTSQPAVVDPSFPFYFPTSFPLSGGTLQK